MKKTKKQMLDDIGFTTAMILEFVDLEYRYNSLEATVGMTITKNLLLKKAIIK